jgi:predicted site-specific integrase-resolvase
MNDERSPIQFVTAAEMAERLGVKASAVRRWARRGDIPKLVLPSGRFVFDPEAVIAALQTNQDGGTDGD